MSDTDLTTEQGIAAELARRGKDAPRVTAATIESKIVGESYYRFEGTTLTVCCLRLENGFTVTGESAAASPTNYVQEIGEKLARKDAVGKIWKLEGYLLRQRLHEQATGQPNPEGRAA